MIARAWFFLVLLACFTAGCAPACDFNWSRDDDVDPSPNAPPRVDAITIADWPPIGPTSTLSATVSDGRGLDVVHFTFANTVVKEASGTEATVSVTGAELGEGTGSLFVDVFDDEGEWSTRQVTNLLVDLSPPTAEIGATTLRAKDGEIEVWVGDAWVLGSVTLDFKGVEETHTFEEGYPSTIGDAWDHSLEVFDAANFPPGKGTATLTVRDAAGNTMTRSFQLRLDGAPPQLAVLSPSAGSEVVGSFDVEVEAADDMGEAVIELYVGGAQVATALGPHAVITLNAADFPAGSVDLEAIAIDDAGNESAPAAVPIVIQ